MSKLKKISGMECVKVLCNKFGFSRRNRPPPVIDGRDARFARVGSFGALGNEVSGAPKSFCFLCVPEFSPVTGGTFLPPVPDRVENSVHYIARQRGSHITLKKETPDGMVGTVVPNHKELKIGTLKGVLRLANIDEDEFAKFL